MKPLIPIEELKEFVGGLDHSEGICYAPNGKVYMGGESGQIYEVGVEKQAKKVASTDGFALGLAADAHSRLYVCDTVHRAVFRINEDFSVQVFSKGSDDKRFGLPNWGCFDARGNFYVSDSGDWGKPNGMVWKITNGIAEIWSTQSRNFPNGMAISHDGKKLLVLESYPSALVEIPINADGSAGDRKVIVEMGEIVPDGIALTTDGRYVISCYRPDSIYICTQTGEMTLLADDPRGTAIAAPTNVAFIGPNLDRMVVPNIGRWHATELAYPGLVGVPLHYPTSELIGS